MFDGIEDDGDDEGIFGECGSVWKKKAVLRVIDGEIGDVGVDVLIEEGLELEFGDGGDVIDVAAEV